MPCSHATPCADQPGRDPGHLKLLTSGARGLPEGLAARVDGHLARFAEHLREGLLAASVAVGLEVMDELMAAEVTEVAGPRGASIELSADGGMFTGTYTFEFPAGPGETTGQIGPGEVTGARIAVEPMGEPVAPFPEASPSPSAQESPAAGSPEPAASPIVLEVSPPPGSLPLPEVSPQESPAA